MAEILLTSAVLICAVVLIRGVFKRRISRRFQYALWSLVALRLLIPFSLFASHISVMNAVPEEGLDTGRVIWYAGARTEYMPDLAVSEPEKAAGDGEAELEYRQNLQIWQSEMDKAAVEAGGRPITLKDVLTAIWIGGSGICLLCLVMSNAMFAARLKRSSSYAGLDFKGVEVYVTEGLVSPCLFGLLSPRIYVTPYCLEDENRLRHVLTHEYVHKRHLDHVWAIIRGICLVIYWFDPFVWLAAVLSRRDSELACDESVIEMLGESDRIDYGRTLVDMMAIRRRPSDLLCAATTMTSGKRGAVERIKLIAKKQRVVAWAIVAALLIAIAAVGCTFTGRGESSEEEFSLEDIAFDDISSATASCEIEGENSKSKITHELSREEIDTIIELLESLREDVSKADKLLGRPEVTVELTGESGVFLMITYSSSPDTVSVTFAPFNGENGLVNIGDTCFTSSELADKIRSLISSEDQDTLLSAVQAAVLDDFGTGWWAPYDIDRGDLELAGFTVIYQQVTDQGIELYGDALYRSYGLADMEDVGQERYALLEDFATDCVVTIDPETLECVEFWLPGDGANHDMDISRRFSEDLAMEFILETDHGGNIEAMREECDIRCSQYFEGAEPLSLQDRLRDLEGDDIKYMSWSSFADLTDEQEMAELLAKAAEYPVDPDEEIESIWHMDVYLDDIGEGTYSTDRMHIGLSAGTQEDLVVISYSNGADRQSMVSTYKPLYDLVRRSNDLVETVDQELLPIFSQQIDIRLDNTLAELQASQNWDGVTGLELVTLTEEAVYDDGLDGVFEGSVYVANFQYAIETSKPESVPFAGGMALDSQMRVIGYDLYTYAVAAVSDGQVVYTGFLAYDAFYGEDHDTAGRQAVISLLEREML